MKKKLILVFLLLLVLVSGYIFYEKIIVSKNKVDSEYEKEITVIYSEAPEKIYQLKSDVLLVKDNRNNELKNEEIKNNILFSYYPFRGRFSEKYLIIMNAELEKNINEKFNSKLNSYTIDIYRINKGDLELYETLDMKQGEYALSDDELYTVIELIEDEDTTYLLLNDGSEMAKLYDIEKKEMKDINYWDKKNDYIQEDSTSVYNLLYDISFSNENMLDLSYSSQDNSISFYLNSDIINENRKILEEYPEIEEQDMLDSHMYVFNLKEEDFDYWFSLAFKTGENPYQDIVLPAKESIDGEEHKINSLEDYKTYAKRFHE